MSYQEEEPTNPQLPCPNCDNYLISGKGDGICSYCNGTGELEISIDPVDGVESMPSVCENCNGSGVCATCHGTGQIEESD